MTAPAPEQPTMSQRIVRLSEEDLAAALIVLWLDHPGIAENVVSRIEDRRDAASEREGRA